MNMDLSTSVRNVILQRLSQDPLARLPLNGLVVWTELGRALAGMLERKGGNESLLRETIEKWCSQEGVVAADLNSVLPRLEPGQRLSREHLARILLDLQQSIEGCVAGVEETGVNDGGRAPWMCAIKGWFPAGLAIIASFDALKQATPAQQQGTLLAWCQRYFPASAEGPESLGVRAV